MAMGSAWLPGSPSCWLSCSPIQQPVKELFAVHRRVCRGNPYQRAYNLPSKFSGTPSIVPGNVRHRFAVQEVAPKPEKPGIGVPERSIVEQSRNAKRDPVRRARVLSLDLSSGALIVIQRHAECGLDRRNMRQELVNAVGSKTADKEVRHGTIEQCRLAR